MDIVITCYYYKDSFRKRINVRAYFINCMAERNFHEKNFWWNKYFLSLNEYFLNRYVTILYAISTVLSSYVAYVLFKVFEFQSPLFKTIILAIVCTIISVIRYRRKGKKKIKEGLNKIRKSILEEETENI